MLFITSGGSTMLKTYHDIVRAGLVITLLSAATVSGQEPGSLLWKTSADWSVNDLASSGDVNGDGFADIFAGSGDNRIYCFSGDGDTKGDVIWSWGVGADVWTVAVLKDVDGDGVDDCLAGAADNTVYCMTGKPTDGLTSIVWAYFAGGDIWTLSPIRDVKGDRVDDRF